MSLPPTQPAARLPEIGEVVAGKYRIDGRLGVGGMGVVLAARHLGLDEPVAIKFLTSTTALEPKKVARFLREGRAAAKIRGEHVARMIDVGTLDDGSPYLVMELLEGRDVAALLRERGRLDLALALSIVIQACEALAEAHPLGVVHRDLKPANMFLALKPDRSTSLKVLDFGISKTDVEIGGVSTTTDSVVGTPQYMAPEQLKGTRRVDRRVDIWALGVILHELLSGRSPFPSESTPEVFAAILVREPTRLGDDLPGAPRAIEALIARCLEKDPERRFRDVGELARALADAGAPDGHAAATRIARILAASKGLVRERSSPPPSVAPPSLVPGLGATEDLHEAAPVDIGSAPTVLSAGMTPSASSLTQPGSSRRRAVIGTAAAMALACAVALGVGLTTRQRAAGAPRVAEGDAPPASVVEATAAPFAVAPLDSPPAEVLADPPSSAQAPSLASAPRSAPPRHATQRRPTAPTAPGGSSLPPSPSQRTFDERRK